MNRVLFHLGSLCADCLEIRTKQRQVDRMMIECERIEAVCDDVLEFVVPSARRNDDDDESERGPYFFLTVEPVVCPKNADIWGHTASELRRIAEGLTTAATAIEVAREGGVA